MHKIQTGPPTPAATVIVVDDEQSARQQVELALMTSKSVKLTGEAQNGMLGAELAEALQPDVIVLDLTMPVMTGFEAIPLLKRVAPRAAILVRSNIDDAAEISRAMALGAAAYVRKMIGPDDLRAAIEEHVPGPATVIPVS